MTPQQIEALKRSPTVDLRGESIDRCLLENPVVIPEIHWKDEDVHRGPGWIRLHNTANQLVKPLIRCKCGNITGIGLHHVHADGRVTASYFDSKETTFEHNGKKYTKEPGCGWHVYLKLDKYDCGEFPPEVG